MANPYNSEPIPDSQDKVEAADINGLITNAEDFVNVGIGNDAWAIIPDHEDIARPTDPPWALGIGGASAGSDDPTTPYGYYSDGFTGDGYIGKKHILKPEFYGSPAPRMEGVSSQVHHRKTGSSDRDAVVFSPSTTGGAYEAIPGTAARVKIRDKAHIYVMASFYCFELGGVQFEKASGDTYGGQTQLAGTVALAIHGQDGMRTNYLPSTKRHIRTNLIAPKGSPVKGVRHLQNNGRLLFHMMGRNQHSIIYRARVNPGVYDIGLVFQCIDNPGSKDSECSLRNETPGLNRVRQSKTVFFKTRNLVLDVQYVDRKTPESVGMEEWRYFNEFDDQKV